MFKNGLWYRLSIKTCTIPRKRNRPFPSKRKWLLYLAIVLVLQLFKPSIYLKRCENKFELKYIQKKRISQNIFKKKFNQYTYLFMWLCCCHSTTTKILFKRMFILVLKKTGTCTLDYISYIFLENMKGVAEPEAIVYFLKKF